MKGLYVYVVFPGTQSRSLFLFPDKPVAVAPEKLAEIEKAVAEYKKWFLYEVEKPAQNLVMRELGLSERESWKVTKTINARKAAIVHKGVRRGYIQLQLPVLPHPIAYILEHSKRVFYTWLQSNTIMLPRRPETIYIMPTGKYTEFKDEVEEANRDIELFKKMAKQVARQVAPKIAEFGRVLGVSLSSEELRKKLENRFDVENVRWWAIPVDFSPAVAKELGLEMEEFEKLRKETVKHILLSLIEQLKPQIAAVQKGTANRKTWKVLREKLEKAREIAVEVGVPIDPLLEAIEKARRGVLHVDRLEEEILSRL